MNSKDSSELIFEVTEEAAGGHSAACLTETIFTQGETWDEVHANVKEAVKAFYFDCVSPNLVRLQSAIRPTTD